MICYIILYYLLALQILHCEHIFILEESCVIIKHTKLVIEECRVQRPIGMVIAFLSYNVFKNGPANAQ